MKKELRTIKKFIGINRPNAKQRGEVPPPPLRTVKEMAAEFNVPFRSLMTSIAKNNPDLITIRTPCAKTKTINSWVEPNATRKWWAEYKLKRGHDEA